MWLLFRWQGLVAVLGTALLFSGCRPVYPPIPKPQPLNAPVNTQAAIDAVIAQPKTSAVATPRLHGVVTRKTLANWLIAQQGGLPKLARPARLLADISDPEYSAAISMSPWSVAFFPDGVTGQSRFNPNAPVTRAEFCVILAVIKGQYATLQNVSADTINQMAPEGALPFDALLDSNSVPKHARGATAWAYQHNLLQKAFNVTPAQLAEQGIHHGQAVEWQAIQPLLKSSARR